MGITRWIWTTACLIQKPEIINLIFHFCRYVRTYSEDMLNIINAFHQTSTNHLGGYELDIGEKNEKVSPREQMIQVFKTHIVCYMERRKVVDNIQSGPRNWDK